MRDGFCRPAREFENAREEVPGERRARVERHRALLPLERRAMIALGPQPAHALHGVPQPVELVELHGALPGLERCLERAIAVFCPAEDAFVVVTERQHRPGKGRAGIERQRVGEDLARFPMPGSVHALLQRKRL